MFYENNNENGFNRYNNEFNAIWCDADQMIDSMEIYMLQK
jgi:hypothetical protein